MDTVGFVILHYNVIDDTIACVQSIQRNIDTNNYLIVVVDNCSPNETGKKLLELYHDEKKIHVILNEMNLGFAKGNNIGIEYAQDYQHCNYICCLNNDTILTEKDFLAKIKKEYLHSNAAVIAPLVYLRNNKIQQYRYQLYSRNYYLNKLKKLKFNNNKIVFELKFFFKKSF